MLERLKILKWRLDIQSVEDVASVHVASEEGLRLRQVALRC